MKKILNGPTVWRAKCLYCDCEFEYDCSEVDSHTFADCKVVKCPGCNRYLHHEDSTKSTTATNREDTMTTYLIKILDYGTGRIKKGSR